MYIALMFLFLIILNTAIVYGVKNKKFTWMKSSFFVMLLCTPLVTIVSAYSIAINEGDGIAGGAGGFAFGVVTFINGVILLFIAIMNKKNIKNMSH